MIKKTRLLQPTTHFQWITTGIRRIFNIWIAHHVPITFFHLFFFLTSFRNPFTINVVFLILLKDISHFNTFRRRAVNKNLGQKYRDLFRISSPAIILGMSFQLIKITKLPRSASTSRLKIGFDNLRRMHLLTSFHPSQGIDKFSILQQ